VFLYQGPIPFTGFVGNFDNFKDRWRYIEDTLLPTWGFYQQENENAVTEFMQARINEGE
jgi:hypothetical protein